MNLQRKKAWQAIRGGRIKVRKLALGSPWKPSVIMGKNQGFPGFLYFFLLNHLKSS